MKRFLVGALIAVGILAFVPTGVRADAALTQANDFARMQNMFMNSTFNYYNSYQLPVLDTYNKAMSDQVSQALAAQYQANIMAQMAMQRQAVNNYQLGMNYNATITNLNTQYMNMLNNQMYNFENNLNNMYFSTLGNVNTAYSTMLGQPKFPQVP